MNDKGTEKAAGNGAADFADDLDELRDTGRVAGTQGRGKGEEGEKKKCGTSRKDAEDPKGWGGRRAFGVGAQHAVPVWVGRASLPALGCKCA
jgi:hypothetical protein